MPTKYRTPHSEWTVLYVARLIVWDGPSDVEQLTQIHGHNPIAMSEYAEFDLESSAVL